MEKSSMFSVERFFPGSAQWSADFPLRFPDKNGGFDGRPKGGRRRPRTKPATPERRAIAVQSDCSCPLPQTIVIPTPMQLWTAPRQLLTFARWRIVIACHASKETRYGGRHCGRLDRCYHHRRDCRLAGRAVHE